MPSSGSNEQARATFAPIIGGFLDTSTHGVVALAFKSRKQVAVFCSGTLLAPNLVLTARHCIAQIGDGSSESVDCASTRFTAEYDPAQIFVSTDAQPQTSNGSLYSLKEIREAPGGSKVCGYDVALLILSSNVPSSVATPIEPALTVTTEAKQIFSAVGYGLQDPTDTKGTSAGSRMRFDGSGVYCVGNLCAANVGVSADEFVGNSPVCSGDSGGPALDSLGRVFGVTSRGDANCTYALYSNVADWAAFIRTAGKDAATAGGYPPDSWVTAAGGDTGAENGGTGGTGGTSASGAATTSGGASSNSGGAGTAGHDTSGGPAMSSGGAVSSAPPPIQNAMPTVSPLGEACETASDCPGAYQCYSATTKPPGTCVPSCGAGCPTGYSCADTLGVCTPKAGTAIKRNASASCALSTQQRHKNGPLALTLLIGCAWLGRRRRSAS